MPESHNEGSWHMSSSNLFDRAPRAVPMKACEYALKENIRAKHLYHSVLSHKVVVDVEFPHQHPRSYGQQRRNPMSWKQILRIHSRGSSRSAASLFPSKSISPSFCLTAMISSKPAREMEQSKLTWMKRRLRQLGPNLQIWGRRRSRCPSVVFGANDCHGILRWCFGQTTVTTSYRKLN